MAPSASGHGKRAPAAGVEQPDVRQRDEQQREVRVGQPGDQHRERRDQAERRRGHLGGQPRGDAPTPDRVVAGQGHDGQEGHRDDLSGSDPEAVGVEGEGRPGDDPDHGQQVEEQQRRQGAAAPGTPTRPAPSPPSPGSGTPAAGESSDASAAGSTSVSASRASAQPGNEASAQAQVGGGAVLRGRGRAVEAWPPGAARLARSPRGSRPRGHRAGRRRRAAAARPPRTGPRRRCRSRSARPARRARWAAPAAPAPRTRPRSCGLRPVWSRERLARRCARAGPRRSAIRPRRRAAMAGAGWPSRAARARRRRRSGCAAGSASANSRAPAAPSLPPSVDTNTSVFVCLRGPELVDQLEQGRGRGRARGGARAARRVARREHDDAAVDSPGQRQDHVAKLDVLAVEAAGRSAARRPGLR